MIMLINSCAGSGAVQTMIINNYCDLALPLPQSQSVKNEIKKIKNNSIELFKFIETSAATKKCECKATDKEKQLCWKEFDNLNKK